MFFLFLAVAFILCVVLLNVDRIPETPIWEVGAFATATILIFTLFSYAVLFSMPGEEKGDKRTYELLAIEGTYLTQTDTDDETKNSVIVKTKNGFEVDDRYSNFEVKETTGKATMVIQETYTQFWWWTPWIQAGANTVTYNIPSGGVAKAEESIVR